MVRSLKETDKTGRLFNNSKTSQIHLNQDGKEEKDLAMHATCARAFQTEVERSEEGNRLSLLEEH